MRLAKRTAGIAILTLLFSVGRIWLDQTATAADSRAEAQRSPVREAQRPSDDEQTHSYQEREARQPASAFTSVDRRDCWLSFYWCCFLPIRKQNFLEAKSVNQLTHSVCAARRSSP